MKKSANTPEITSLIKEDRNTDFIYEMAKLGDKHAKMLNELFTLIQNETNGAVERAENSEIHFIYISAGKGAYHGAMRYLLKDAKSPLEVVETSDSD